MKLRKGERITCGEGHHAGDVLADVPDGGLVPTAAVALFEPSPIIDGRARGCSQCGEVVAERLNDDRWRVRTPRGWVS